MAYAVSICACTVMTSVNIRTTKYFRRDLLCVINSCIRFYLDKICPTAGFTGKSRIWRTKPPDAESSAPALVLSRGRGRWAPFVIKSALSKYKPSPLVRDILGLVYLEEAQQTRNLLINAKSQIRPIILSSI